MWKTALTLALAALLMAAPAVRADEAELIATLKSADASVKDKADACRLLSRCGTAKAVPVLAGLLDQPNLAHYARYALEPIPAPEVDEALRAALGKLTGLHRVGVIASIGVRKDAKAVAALAALLKDADPTTAQTAAKSLGQIGTVEAAKAIEDSLASVSDENRSNFCEGLLRAAEALSEKGQVDQAIALYDKLRTLPKAPHQVRTAGFRGVVLARQAQGIPMLMEAVRGDDWILVGATARTALELKAPETSKALADELPKLNADKQILFCQTLGLRGDAAAGPALLELAKNGKEGVQVVAIRSVTQIGYAPAVPVLAQLALSGAGEAASVARSCLASFPGKEGDQAIGSLLAAGDAKARCLGAELVAQRFSGPAAAVLLIKAADDQDESVRLAAIKALRDTAGLSELAPMLAVLLKGRGDAEIKAVESAVGALCARQTAPASGNVTVVKAVYGSLPNGPMADVTKKVAKLVKDGTLTIEASNSALGGDPAQGLVKKLKIDYTVSGQPATKTVGEGENITLTTAVVSSACVDPVVEAVAKAKGEPKLALLRILRTAGGPKALQAVQAALNDSDPQVKDTAVRVLCDWTSPDALPAVAELTKSSDNKVKILSLRGYIRLIPQANLPVEKKVEMLQQAAALATQTAEKRLLLAALGDVPSLQSLEMVAAHLDGELKEEACIAAVSIGDRIVGSNPAEVKPVMQKVAKTTRDKQLAARANAVFKKARK
ncbi:MAG TPA: HEAT repeat domain-containing protein [Phycisphaerae bacterium]|nr:HEAT repeat domain-containing protein [Phycisphaerae bacterium]